MRALHSAGGLPARRPDRRVALRRNEDQATHAGWTSFDGFEAKGWVMATIIRGMVVIRDGEVTTPSAGKPLKFLEAL